MLIQVGPNRPWLLNYYQKVPHPRTLACVEELLYYGFVPLITDFHMIIKHNDIVGMDFTFFRNGYKYHTRFDDHASVSIESIQHVGDNLLILIQELANAPELKPLAQTVDNVVFYDVFELFVIHCTATHAGLIHCTVFVLSIALALRSFHNFGLRLCRQSLIYLGLMSSAITVGWFTAAIFIAIEALIIDAFEYNLSWYNNRLIIFGLYVIPTNICIFSVTLIFNYFNDKNLFTIGARTQIQLHLLRLIWTIVLIIGTFVHFRFMYVVLIPIIFQMFAFGLIELFSISRTMKKWLIVYVLGMVLPTMFLMQHALQIIIIFISVYGRLGPDKNSEVRLGILVVVLTILTISYYMPLITLVRKPMALVMTLTLMFVIYVIILMTPFGFPYSGNPESPAPQRYYIYHMKRIFRNDSNEIFKNDSGFYLLNSDRNSPNNLKKYITELSDTKSLSEDCDRSLFCGLPIVNTKIIPIL
ncbi:hypothetical protein RI129_003819 [Pyrocoelia pectoralis]|uniref:Peptidase M28 domain-containing protein n=1 Tax=Pyrocoelia pectoralis TaxID=417401 RepID=A0AAN7VIJ6_9COLE